MSSETTNGHATARAILLYAVWKVHNMLRRQGTPAGFNEIEAAKYIWASLRKEFVASHKANKCRQFFQSPTTRLRPPMLMLVDVGVNSSGGDVGPGP